MEYGHRLNQFGAEKQNMHVSELNIYPIKSCAPVKVDRIVIEAEGLANDRRFMVTDPDGSCLTARQWPKMLGVEAQFDGQTLEIATPDGDKTQVAVSELGDQYQQVTIWKDSLQAQRCTPQADDLLSSWLGTTAQIVYLGPKSHRPFRDTQSVSFADAAPLLVTTTASLNRLNQEMDSPVTMRRFRSNIIIEGAEPFAEHQWDRLKLADVELEMVWACERCVLTTIDEHTWTKDIANEPLRTLRLLNRDERGKINFGHNATAAAPGVISVGDTVQIA